MVFLTTPCMCFWGWTTVIPIFLLSLCAKKICSTTVQQQVYKTQDIMLQPLVSTPLLLEK